MDAVEYIKAEDRLCKFYKKNCIECPLTNLCNPNINPEEHVAIVEAWVKKHPLMTNFEKFIEVFGIKRGEELITDSWWDKEYKNPND